MVWEREFGKNIKGHNTLLKSKGPRKGHVTTEHADGQLQAKQDAHIKKQPNSY